jgi:hypothetical protein
MWTCLNCIENIDGQFDSCWSCGTKRDGTPPEKPLPVSVTSKPKDEWHSMWSAFLRMIGFLLLAAGVVTFFGASEPAMFFSFVAISIPFFFFAFLADVCTENRWLMKKLLEKRGRDDG